MTALLADSEKPMEKARWKPADIVCVADGSDDSAPRTILRTKFVRGPDSAAVCASEAIAHAVLQALDLEVAEAFAVITSADLSSSLTAQLGYDEEIIPGSHWGTVRLFDASASAQLRLEHHASLIEPEHAFLIYLADVLLAYPDRQTTGNILLVPDEAGKSLRLIPIDQSDCFGTPGTFRDPKALDGMKDQSVAVAFPQLDSLILTIGRRAFDRCVGRVLAARSDILAAVGAPEDEWLARAGIDPDSVSAFLEYRLNNLEALARLAHWRGVLSVSEGYSGVIL